MCENKHINPDWLLYPSPHKAVFIEYDYVTIYVQLMRNSSKAVKNEKQSIKRTF